MCKTPLKQFSGRPTNGPTNNQKWLIELHSTRLKIAKHDILKYYQIIHLCKVLLSSNLRQPKRKQVFDTKSQEFVLERKLSFALCSLFYILCSLFFVLCSLSFVLCSLFFVLCFSFFFFFASWKGDKRTTVPSSFSKEEFVWWLNTPILVFIHQMKMCWFFDSTFFWRTKKLRKKLQNLSNFPDFSIINPISVGSGKVND